MINVQKRIMRAYPLSSLIIQITPTTPSTPITQSALIKALLLYPSMKILKSSVTLTCLTNSVSSTAVIASNCAKSYLSSARAKGSTLMYPTLNEVMFWKKCDP